ncbi:MAG: M48 family metallopeptidase [Candidatus Micrarchaeota archaeon]|nr:M48 family metallopeptidase [Candidatus Micrarchaeota archaeon]
MAATSFWDVQSRNKLYSYLLVGGMFVLVALLAWFAGYLVNGGDLILPFALLFSMLYAVGGYYWGDKVVLGVSGAREADEKQYAYLHNTVEGLALAAGIPEPKLYVIQDDSPNAFATGRDPQHASIAVTSGLLARMNRAELEGVLGHEMSHIRNFDSRFMTTVIVLVGLVSILANIMSRMMLFGGGRRDRERGDGGALLMIIGLVFMILAPIFATLIQLAISRKREFLADASGAQLTRNPEGLASALEKLKTAPPMAHANSATASLYISDPNGGGKPSLGQQVSGLFSTHPPLDERIKILREM